MVENSLKNEVLIKDVVFLTPAKIKASIDGKEEIIMVSVDLINRKVYKADGDSSLSNYFFEYLDAVTTLPEDFFSAPEDVVQEAENAEKTRQEIFNEAIGGISE
jgi:hypothetical protein